MDFSSWTLLATIPLAIVAVLSSHLVYTGIKFFATSSKYRHIPRHHRQSVFALFRLVDAAGGMEAMVEELYDKENHCNHAVSYEGFFFGGLHMVGLTNPDDYKTVLNDLTSFPKDPTYVFLEDFIGKGLVSATEDTWKHHRRVLSPAFHFQFLKNLTPLMTRLVGKMIQELHATNAMPVDPFYYFSGAALDVIIECSVGSDTVHVRSLADDFRALANQAFAYIFGVLALGPLKGIFSFASDMAKRKKGIMATIKQAVDKKREQLRHQPELKDRKDFISLMLASGELGEQEILDEALTFFFAAHDTTSSTLTWATYFLCKHPEYQEKIQQELDENGFDLDTVTAEQLESFPLLKMFINESLRFRPPVPSLTRELREDRELSGQLIPAGTIVNLFLQATHFDPAYWDEPEKFYPERFARDSEEANSRHPFAFLPVSAGPRSCIGKRFAMQEAQILLGAVLSNFSVEGKTAGIVADTKNISRPLNFKARFIPRSK